MARPSHGWTVRKKKGRDTFEVRFTHGGIPISRSTGCTDEELAREKAPGIYAHYVQTHPLGKQRPKRTSDSPPLEELVSEWLANDSTIAPSTVPTYLTYGTHWCRKWESLVPISDASTKEYRNDRLRVVIADTVRKELSALRKFLEWCTDNGYLDREIEVASVPRKATGTRYAKRRRKAAPELSPEDVEAVLARLPEWAANGGRKQNITAVKAKYPVRARFIVGYETGLRPSFLDELSVPENYRRGAAALTIWVEDDKNRFAREVPLTARARQELDAVCPDIGLVFGKHDYRIPIRRAASKVLPPAKAEIFTGAHFRSAQATHTLEGTGNIPGAMHLFGWTQVSTASRYTKPSQRAAEAVIREREAQREEAQGHAAKPTTRIDNAAPSRGTKNQTSAG